MSLEYELRIVTDWQALDILNLLSRELELEWEETRLFGPGIVLGATPETEHRQSMMMETFGFKPTLDLWFWLDSQENSQRGKQILLEASMLVLNHLSGDAVLLFNSEYTVLQRISGFLIFNQEIPLTSKDELEKFNQPFYIQPLRSLLLYDRPTTVAVDHPLYSQLQAVATAREQSPARLANEAIAFYLREIKQQDDINKPIASE
ncbi:ribbon-helix-helix domain-containing protein [Laspinema olomoucense]|uniref:Ribbon-helix-helix domain-containing protein n=1 Tax=Laspinema olomoucense D3b TaxID=2953688 RepID=A0ABT2N756_9CYAN|nr:ribbon-helix-helix domain-containing protein [Laspinema sp. D3b]MCT7978521.1 ribbon-helix-helix domain-containing protein [Laspinema sp. D3b]